jgi:outer membrane cobalamin receptor
MEETMDIDRLFFWGWRLYFLFSGWLFSQVCFAAENTPLRLEELLNTQVSVASFIDERDIDVASSVTRINAWEWQRRSSRTLSDALEMVPSLVNYSSVGQGEAIAIRGFARNNSTRGTATFLDGVPINDFMLGSSQIDKPDIQLGVLDNIQVIRGPGSVLYGTDAFHGVLSLNAFHADRDITTFMAKASSANYYRQSLKHSSKLSPHIRQHFAVGLSGQGDQHRPYQYTDPSDSLLKGSERALEYNAESLVYKWDIQASDAVRYSANLYANNHKTREFPSVSRLGGLSVARDLDVNNAHAEFGLASLKRTQAMGDLSMDMMLWQWQTHQSFTFDRSRYTAQNHINQMVSQLQRGVGFRLQQNQSRWLVDFNYRYQGIIENRADIVNADQSIFSTTVSRAKGMQRDIYSLGVSIKEDVLNGKLSLLGGVREDYYADFGKHISPRLGMIYYINANHVAKLLYSEAFRAPVATEIAHAVTKLEPETIQTYELVWMHQKQHYKQEWVAFASDWKAGIVLTPSLSGPPSYANHQEHASQGIESIHHLIWSRWHVKGSLAWVQSEDQTRHVDYIAFPDYIFNLELSYFWPNQHVNFTFSNRVLWGLSEGPIVSSVPSPKELNHFWRSDVYIKKTFRPNIDGFVFAKNLLDRTNKMPSIYNAEGGYQEEPFSIGVGMYYQFE